MPIVKNLQALRGAAAVMILAHHIGFNSVITRCFGDFAVSLFFVLSGFVLTLAYNEHVKDGRIPRIVPFMRRRLAKIYPLYLITMIMAWILPGHYGGATAIVPDLLMIQSWIPVKTIYFSGNAIGWFISDIVFCYILFLPTLRLIHSHTRSFHIALALFFIAYFTIVFFIPDTAITPVIYILPPMQFPPFLLGMLLGVRICTSEVSVFGISTQSTPAERSRSLKPDVTIAFLLFSVILTGVMMLLYPQVTKRLTLCSYWWLPSLCLILSFTLADRRPTLFTRILHTPILQRAGDLSYPFFLLHLTYLHFTRSLLAQFDIHLTPWSEFLTAIPILFFLSYLTVRYVLRPLHLY